MHGISEPAAWRGGLQVSRRNGRRCQTLGGDAKKRGKSRRSIGSATPRRAGVEEKPWINEESRSSEEGLQRLKEENLEKTARRCCDGLRPEVPTDLSKRNEGD